MANANVHVSRHPCLKAKLSQLRSASANSKETRTLVHEIALILGTEALSSSLQVESGPKQDASPLGYQYPVDTIVPSKITLVPILRSGLGMLDAVQTILPEPVSVHHLGLFRDPLSLQPVEYYNNLPFTRPTTDSPRGTNTSAAQLAIILDPVIATGGTSAAAVNTLKEWGVQSIIVIAVLASKGGLQNVAEEWPEATEIWVGGVDEELNDKGMIKPGLGDVGDRLFLTMGK